MARSHTGDATRALPPEPVVGKPRKGPAPPWQAPVAAALKLAKELGGPEEVRQEIAAVAEGFTPEIRVASAGMLKAGKSSLLNALVGEDERFATGDARKTVENQVLDWGDFVLVDTPGLDATDLDTEQAEETFRAADLILLVHSVSAGEYDQMEVAFLQRLTVWLPDEDHRARALLPVLTKIDMAPDDLAEIRGKCAAQWEKYVGGGCPEFAEVSNSRCLKGLREERPKLVELSGIPRLRGAITERFPVLQGAKRRLLRDRLRGHLNALQQWVDKEVATARDAEAREHAAIEKQRKRCHDDAEKVFAAIRERYEEYRLRYGSARVAQQKGAGWWLM